MFKCDKCSRSYNLPKNLARHMRETHSNTNFGCDVCEFSCTRAETLGRHKKIHERTKKKNYLCCGLCSKQCIDRKRLQQHYVDQHNISLVHERCEFSSESEFYEWKSRLEKDENCHFVKCSGGYLRGLDEAFINNYACFRDGFFKSASSGKRNSKFLGSNKINSHCPAKIRTTHLPNGTVFVDHFKTHVGHSHEVERMRLRKEEKEGLASKIAQNISFDEILESVRIPSNGTDVTRSDLLTKKDLHNICRGYNLKPETIIRRDYKTTVPFWVGEMLSAEGLVRFYKPKSQLSDIHTQLEVDDFFLIIMNDDQIDLLKRYGQNFICVDRTPVKNSYGYELTTIVILDDLHECFPCAFMFSSRRDRVAVEIYFETVRDAIGTVLAPDVLMTDMSDVFYRAWLQIMGPVKCRLFCSWHVHRVWRSHLPKINSGRKKKAEVYALLKAVMEERDEKIFSTMFEESVRSLKDNPLTRPFGVHFDREYGKSVKSWAFCYHQCAGLTTNTHLEKIHSEIEHIYLRDDKRKRLDIVLQSLMRLLREKIFSRLTHFWEEKLTCELIRERHQSSLRLNPEVVTCEGDSWKIVFSQCSEITIVKNDESCKCSLRCPDCNVCIHSLICSCLDSSLKFNLCEHMHLIYTTLKQNSDIVDTPVNVTEDVNLILDDDFHGEEQIITEEMEETSLLNECNSSLEEKRNEVLQEVEAILNYAQSDEDFQVILTTLKSINPTLQAIRQSSIHFTTIEPPPLKRIKSNRNYDMNPLENEEDIVD